MTYHQPGVEQMPRKNRQQMMDTGFTHCRLYLRNLRPWVCQNRYQSQHPRNVAVNPSPKISMSRSQSAHVVALERIHPSLSVLYSPADWESINVPKCPFAITPFVSSLICMFSFFPNSCSHITSLTSPINSSSTAGKNTYLTFCPIYLQDFPFGIMR